MKKIYILIISSFFITVSSFAQSSAVEIKDEEGINRAGETISLTGMASQYEINSIFYLKNVGENTTFNWARKVISTSNPGFLAQLCDDALCYTSPASNEYAAMGPTKEIPTGTEVMFKPQLNTTGATGTATVVYYVLDGDLEMVDSLTIVFESTLGITNEKSIDFSIYPNPAQDEVSIQGENFNGGTVIFTDALGKEVKREKVTPSSSTINISNLRRGVYFVNVKDASGNQSAIQRLVKR